MYDTQILVANNNVTKHLDDISTHLRALGEDVLAMGVFWSPRARTVATMGAPMRAKASPSAQRRAIGSWF